MDSKTFLQYAEAYISEYVDEATRNYSAVKTQSQNYPMSFFKLAYMEEATTSTSYEVGAKMLMILKKKNLDYSQESNAFENFESSAREASVSVSSAIKVRIVDKISRMKNLMGKDVSPMVEDEPLKDTILDIMNYMIISMIYEDYKNNELLPLKEVEHEPEE